MAEHSHKSKTLALVKPPALVAPARVSIVAPASSAQKDRVDAGLRALEQRGFEPVLGANVYRSHPPYFSAPAEDRLRELNDALLDPETSAVMSIRGGYGSNYLLPGLALAAMNQRPKVLFGYSDLTVIQTWLLDQLGLVGFQGPLVAGDFDRENGVDESSFTAATTGGCVHLGPEQGLRPLHVPAGQTTVRGTVYGGCLSMLVSVLGTPYEPKTEGKLLFLEDVEERPYRIDRMLRQMILAGKFAGVRGFIFGQMPGCVPRGEDHEQVERVIVELLKDFDVPIAFGLRAAHTTGSNVTLPLGIEAELRLGLTPVLEYLEPAVTA